MPRPRCYRKVHFSPPIRYFKPVGQPLSELEEVALQADELEAIRLASLEGLSQTDAAAKMQISQSTFHRLLLAARQKVADALVNGKALRIENIEENQNETPGCGQRRRHRGGINR